jgi:SPP1 family predicted phage head-tail adaptor
MKDPARAGDLRFRVLFQKMAAGDATYGTADGPWQDQFTRWASIKILRAGENVQAQRLAGIKTAVIIVRYDSSTKTIGAAWRAIHLVDSQAVETYALKSAADMEGQRKFWTMMAETGAADG